LIGLGEDKAYITIAIESERNEYRKHGFHITKIATTAIKSLELE